MIVIIVVGRRNGKSVFAEYAEKCADVERRQLQELIDAFEQSRLEYEGPKEPPEEDLEDDEDWASLDCPCSRQSPGGHRIPWYTAGFT